MLLFDGRMTIAGFRQPTATSAGRRASASVEPTLATGRAANAVELS
jgi:hypothetical protein